MIKKFLTFSVFALFLLNLPANAETITVQAEDDFSTAEPSKTFTVKILKDIQLDEDTTLKNGDIVTGEITSIKQPTRLKRDASFSFKPVQIKNKNEHTEITTDNVAKYTTKLNKAEIAKSAALTVGNHFVKGLTIGYRAVEGAVKNEKGNRIDSSAEAVYENLPISYVEKGENVIIKKGQVFYLQFQNYKPNKK